MTISCRLHLAAGLMIRLCLGVVLVALGVVAADSRAMGGESGSEEGAGGPSVGLPRWDQVVPGIQFARVTAGRYCRSGSRELAVVRLDPAGIRLEPFHESEFPAGERASVTAWQTRLKATVVVNAGLYTEDREHLGTLRRDGEDIGGVNHRNWKGMLVSEPPGPVSDGDGVRGGARILDLSLEADREVANHYPTAVQSMMLLDRNGEIRVRRSDRVAPRTVVAELETGFLVIVVTEGSYTLWETGALLRESGWGVVAAMALDGGSESNLVVASDAVQYTTGGGDTDYRFRLRTKLPGVIAVWSGER